MFAGVVLSGLGVIMEFTRRNVGLDQVCGSVYARIHPVSEIKQEKNNVTSHLKFKYAVVEGMRGFN